MFRFLWKRTQRPQQQPPNRNPGWDEFVEEHLLTISGLAPKSRSSIEHTLRRFGDIIRPDSPAAICFVNIENFVSQLRDAGLQPATINKELRNLSSTFNAAIDREYIQRSPVRRRHYQHVVPKIIRVLAPGEQDALLDACPNEQWQTFVFTLLTAGIRLNQLRPTTWGDYDLGEQPTLRVRSQKRGAERLLPLAAETARRLQRLKAQTLQAGGPFLEFGHTRSVQRCFRQIVARARIKYCTIHDLRRTFCTRLAELGVNEVVVQNLAGHASIQTTSQFYQKISQSVQRTAIERLAKDMAG